MSVSHEERVLEFGKRRKKEKLLSFFIFPGISWSSVAWEEIPTNVLKFAAALVVRVKKSLTLCILAILVGLVWLRLAGRRGSR